MSEFSFFDEERLDLVEKIVRAKFERLAQEVVKHLLEFPEEARTAPAHYGLASFWEEFKYQVQREESVCFEVYEFTIRTACDCFIEELSRDDQGLLWLCSKGYWECDLAKDWGGEIPYGDPVNEALRDELYQRIVAIAESEELAFDPDAEQDDEELDEEEVEEDETEEDDDHQQDDRDEVDAEVDQEQE